MAFVLAAIALGRCSAGRAGIRETEQSAPSRPTSASIAPAPALSSSSAPAPAPSPPPASAPSISAAAPLPLEAQLTDLRTQVRVLEHQRLDARERGDTATEARLDTEIAHLRAEHERLAHPPEGI